MKNYTSLKQSKRLAEILPIESVDWEKTTTYRVSQAIINLENK